MYLIVTNNGRKGFKIVNSLDGLRLKKKDRVEIHGHKKRGLLLQKDRNSLSLTIAQNTKDPSITGQGVLVEDV